MADPSVWRSPSGAIVVGAAHTCGLARSVTAAGRRDWKERFKMPSLEVLTKDDIEARRRCLLRDAAMTEDELRERARSYTLTARESGILSEVDGLEFLLGE